MRVILRKDRAWLKEPFFTIGQHYMAVPRVGSLSHLYTEPSEQHYGLPGQSSAMDPPYYTTNIGMKM